jgi:hypothetical protein
MLLANIDDITNTVIDIGEKINQLSAIKAPKLTFSDASGTGTYKFMTDRQIAKKIIILGGNMSGISASPAVEEALNRTVPQQGSALVSEFAGQQVGSIDANLAHLMVYGKFMYNENGMLIDNEILFPDCVAGEGEGKGESGITNMSVDFPLMQWIRDIKKEFKFAIAGLRIKAGELGQAFIDMQFQLVLAITTLASAATILPPGSGLPTALSAIKSIPTTLMAFQTRIMQLIPYLKPLTFLKVLIPMDKVDAAVAPINVILNLIKRPFAIIDVILTLVTALAGATPPVPGADGVTPADPMEVKPSAEPNNIPIGNPANIQVKLKANASKGSWKYVYQWSSDPFGFVSSKADPIVTPKFTTKYICKVADKNDTSNLVTAEIIVTAI